MVGVSTHLDKVVSKIKGCNFFAPHYSWASDKQSNKKWAGRGGGPSLLSWGSACI